jgi:hypothetical protein
MNLKDISPTATAKKMNRIMESRFGYAIDYSNLSIAKANKLNSSLGENISRIRKSYGVHTAEKNPKYMELLLVREALGKWISEHNQLTEGEMGKSSAILAAKDMVDSIQDMLEKVSKMQVEQMPALIDTIRDQIGNDQADNFKNSVGGLLSSMVDQLTQAREQADGAARSLAGEGPAAGMSMPGGEMGGAPMPGGPAPSPASDLDQAAADSFGATDAAAGGPEALGREKR